MTEKRYESKGDNQRRLLEDVASASLALPEAPVKDIIRGDNLLAVTSSRMGICSVMGQSNHSAAEESPQLPVTAQELVFGLISPSIHLPDSMAYAMAALNSLLPVPDLAVPLKAQDLILSHGKGKNVAMIGHFAFVEKLEQAFRNLWVMELRPRPGDLPAKAAVDVLPRADVVAMTATTLLNGTCADLLALIPERTFSIMLGPSTPFASCLFDWGIDALGGSRITDPDLAGTCIRAGLPFKYLKGVEPLIWTKEVGLSCVMTP